LAFFCNTPILVRGKHFSSFSGPQTRANARTFLPLLGSPLDCTAQMKGNFNLRISRRCLAPRRCIFGKSEGLRHYSNKTTKQLHFLHTQACALNQHTPRASPRTPWQTWRLCPGLRTPLLADHWEAAGPWTVGAPQQVAAVAAVGDGVAVAWTSFWVFAGRGMGARQKLR